MEINDITNIVEAADELKVALFRARQIAEKYLEIDQYDCETGMMSAEDLDERVKYNNVVEKIIEQLKKQKDTINKNLPVTNDFTPN
jgi:hypothetical protein